MWKDRFALTVIDARSLRIETCTSVAHVLQASSPLFDLTWSVNHSASNKRGAKDEHTRTHLRPPRIRPRRDQQAGSTEERVPFDHFQTGLRSLGLSIPEEDEREIFKVLLYEKIPRKGEMGVVAMTLAVAGKA